MGSNPLIGAWRLVTYEAHTGDDVLYPLGEDASGYIMYTPDGYMSVLMMAADRKNFAAGDMLAGTDEEKLAAASTFVAYCGRYDYQGGPGHSQDRGGLLPEPCGDRAGEIRST